MVKIKTPHIKIILVVYTLYLVLFLKEMRSSASYSLIWFSISLFFIVIIVRSFSPFFICINLFFN